MVANLAAAYATTALSQAGLWKVVTEGVGERNLMAFMIFGGEHVRKYAISIKKLTLMVFC